MAPGKLNIPTSAFQDLPADNNTNNTATSSPPDNSNQTQRQSQVPPPQSLSARAGKLSRTKPESSTPSSTMDQYVEDDEMARSGDRSALLQQGVFYNNTTHHHHQEHIAYDNPTAHHEQIEREETPHRTAASSCAAKETPLSPPPSYNHVLNENRLYARDGPSTSSPSNGPGCPHHRSSPRIDSDEGTQTTQLSESDSDSQYLEHCSCQLTEKPSTSSASTTMQLQQQQRQLHHPPPTKHYSAAGVETDTITLKAGDEYPESRMFTAWQHSQGQAGSDSIEISNKCSKQLYKLMAAEGYGICKMSSECRCDDCQSNYFDCDDNEQQKTDGGLGAGAPMFINEVMQGSACNIL